MIQFEINGIMGVGVSFVSTGKFNSMVELFTSASRDFDSTIKFNASMGEE